MTHAVCSDFSWIVIDKKANVMKEDSTEGTERKLDLLRFSKNLFLNMTFRFFLYLYFSVLNCLAVAPYFL